jgi:small conductance mechanosensitive channel
VVAGTGADGSDELAAIELSKRRRTVEALAVTILRVLILVLAAVAVAVVIFPDLDAGPIIAALGVVGAGLAIALQNVIRDYIAGVFILAENQYARGDIVELADVQGTVEDFGLRRTVLRDLNGTVHTVPNGAIRVASNMTRVWNRVNLDLTIPYGTDIDRVTQVVDGVGGRMAEDPAWSAAILRAPHVARVEALADSGVTLKVLGTVRAADRWSVAGELRKRILGAFAENGILLAGAQEPAAAGPGPATGEAGAAPPSGPSAPPRPGEGAGAGEDATG